MSEIPKADFQQFCIKFSELDSEAAQDLFNVVTIKTYKKGTFLLKSGTECRHLFFVNEGFGKIFFKRMIKNSLRGFLWKIDYFLLLKVT